MKHDLLPRASRFQWKFNLKFSHRIKISSSMTFISSKRLNWITLYSPYRSVFLLISTAFLFCKYLQEMFRGVFRSLPNYFGYSCFIFTDESDCLRGEYNPTFYWFTPYLPESFYYQFLELKAFKGYELIYYVNNLGLLTQAITLKNLIHFW